MWCISVYKRIFFSDRIEYRILFVQAKSTESNIEYYSFCKKYSNNIRMVQNIRIFEYFWIILKDKIKNDIKNWTLKIANETWILDTNGLKKFEFLQLIICCKIIFSCQKWNWNFQNLCISSDFWRQIFGNIRAKYSNNIRPLEIALNRIRILIFGGKYSNIRIYSNICSYTVSYFSNSNVTDKYIVKKSFATNLPYAHIILNRLWAFTILVKWFYY